MVPAADAVLVADGIDLLHLAEQVAQIINIMQVQIEQASAAVSARRYHSLQAGCSERRLARAYLIVPSSPASTISLARTYSGQKRRPALRQTEHRPLW